MSNGKINAPVRGWAGMLLALLAALSPVQAGTDVLVLGGSQPYSSEAAFPPSAIASNLQFILSGDSGISQPVTVRCVDTYQANGVDRFLSRTLMSWYYWPYTRTSTDALLGEGWNYVVMIDDPHVASIFPEYHFEGVKAISDAVRKAGSVPISVMTWSSGSTALSTFGEMAYRVGDGTGVAVAPAGYAWNNVSAGLKDTGTRPTPRGAYVTAATVYSRIFDRSAKVSTYIPSGVTLADRNSLADTALTTVQTEATRSHYSGVCVRPTHFASPLNTKRTLEYTDFNSSTEWRIRPGFADSMTYAGVAGTVYLGGYQSFPALGRQIDFCQQREYYNADTTRWRNFASFDYVDNYGGLTMMTGVDRVMYRDPNPEQETGASDVSVAWMSQGEFFVPVRLLYSRIRTVYPTFPVYEDYHHLTYEVSAAVGSAMFSLLTGRCPIADVEPADKASSAWQKWYAIKVGYELAWQHATLNSRVPGFQVKPSAVSATNLTVGAIEPLTVRFRYAPTSTVTVAVSVNNTNAAMINPAVLTFTPYNFDVIQTVQICGTPGLLANEAVNVNLVTASPDGVFNGLTDQWAYNSKRSVTTNVVVSTPAERNVTVTEDTPKVIDLGVTGATSSNTVVVGPVHGTWTAATFTYTPATNYYGSDRIAFYVTTNGTLTVNSVSITVTNVPDSVLLISPTNNAEYSVVEAVPMSVNGYWGGGRVDYLANGVQIGSVSNEPWSTTWNNMSPGSYGIKAVAYDISGVAVTSAQANVTITPSSGMWWTSSSGVWGTNTNWRGRYIPDAVPALFNGVDISGSITVQVDGVRESSKLVFGDAVKEETKWLIGTSQWGDAYVDLSTPPACWVVSDGGNNLNTLTLSGTPAVIEVQDLGDRSPAIRPNEYAAVMDLKLTASNGLVKQGPGTLVLSETNAIRGGVTIQSALGGVMAGVNGALGNDPITMYENTWLGSVDGSGTNGLITFTNAIQLAGSTNANYRIGPGMASDLAISGKIDGSTIGSGSMLMLGGRGRGIWAAGTSVPAQRTANTIAGATTFTVSGDVDIGARTLALLGCWPCSGNLTNRITAGQITAGNLMYDYAGNGQSLTFIGGSSVVNLSGTMSCATNGQLIIRDQAQVTVTGQLTGNAISITNQAQLTAGGLFYAEPAAISTVYFQGGTTDVKSIRMGVAHFNGGVVRAGTSTNNFLEGPSTLLDGNYWVQTGGLNFDTDGYDVEISHSLKHGTAVPVDGGLQKLGLGRLTLSATNTFNGPVSVAAGMLAVNGTLGTNSSVTVASGATLSGTGTIARAVVIQSGGILTPGSSGSALTVQNSLAMQSGSAFNVSWGNSQVIVNGNVALSNSVLSVTGTGGGYYLLIDNRGTNPVAGTFSGLPESALVSVGGVSRWLTYVGGDGNDVALRSLQVTNLAASTITRTSATLQGCLQYVGGAYDVLVYWGTTDGGTNATAWAHTNIIGSCTNVTITNVAFNTSSVLSQGGTYYYTFRATNATAAVWAQPSASLITVDTPEVGNSSGATHQGASSSTLQGLLTAGGVADAWICWGGSDGGISSTGAWDKVQAVGTVIQGVVFTSPVTGLVSNKTYFYRCFVTNAVGQAWSASASSFNATPAGGSMVATSSGSTVTNYTLNGTNYTAHIFTNSGSFNIMAGGDVDVLVVGGGGGGGGGINSVVYPYGGGGGQVLSVSGVALVAGINNVVVGSGGIGVGNGAAPNGTGGASSFAGYTALGGGTPINGSGVAGASGSSRAGGAKNGTAAGGGGGDSSAGQNAPGNTTGGAGGAGTVNSLSGSTHYYGGGGGGQAGATQGAGGLGGGGAGAVAGNANTGGGGGGSANGGSGIVIVRYVASGNGVIQNLAPAGVRSSGASLNAVLYAAPTNYAVTVYWGAMDGGTNAGTWAHSASVGSWTNVALTNIAYQVNGLSALSTYYYAFCAQNAGTNVWAQPSWQFVTRPTPTVPAVANQRSSPSGNTSAMLSGLLTGGTEADAWICWGDNDGGIISTSVWDHVQPVGAVDQDVVFATPVTGLATNTTYLYRCFVTNAAGQAWSAAPTSFNPTPSGGSGGGFSATNSGGTVTNYTLNGTNYTAHVFTNNGTLFVGSAGTIEVLVVAGGGGGGGVYTYGSGGGAGGLIYSNAYPVVTGSNYTVAVGGGGAGNNNGVGANGANSVFGSLTAIGGGGGSSCVTKTGNNGGSGGGAYLGGTAGTGLQPGSASGGYGHNGSVGGTDQGGGGGGAGTNLPNSAGDGGYGLAFSISGSNVYYAGGGNGNWSTTVVPGGGGIINASGAANTGGGGGGASGANPGSGGSGIVIVRYVAGSASSAIQNLAPTVITNNAAVLNAALSAASTSYAVTAYWGVTDGGTNGGLWDHNAPVGSWTNESLTNIAYQASGLASATTTYYTFLASNAGTNEWAQPSWRFTTPAAVSGSYVNLTVNSPYGTSSPSGVTTAAANAVINAFISGSPITLGTTQYVATGWIGTGSLTNGTGTNATFAITTDTTITWQWSTNYWIDFSVIGN